MPMRSIRSDMSSLPSFACCSSASGVGGSGVASTRGQDLDREGVHHCCCENWRHRSARGEKPCGTRMSEAAGAVTRMIVMYTITTLR